MSVKKNTKHGHVFREKQSKLEQIVSPKIDYWTCTNCGEQKNIVKIDERCWKCFEEKGKVR